MNGGGAGGVKRPQRYYGVELNENKSERPRIYTIYTVYGVVIGDSPVLSKDILRNHTLKAHQEKVASARVNDKHGCFLTFNAAAGSKIGGLIRSLSMPASS